MTLPIIARFQDFLGRVLDSGVPWYKPLEAYPVAMTDDASGIDLSDPVFDAPTCPTCHVVLRDADDGLRCPECGWTLPFESAVRPPEFDGPSIHGG